LWAHGLPGEEENRRKVRDLIMRNHVAPLLLAFLAADVVCASAQKRKGYIRGKQPSNEKEDRRRAFLHEIISVATGGDRGSDPARKLLIQPTNPPKPTRPPTRLPTRRPSGTPVGSGGVQTTAKPSLRPTTKDPTSEPTAKPTSKAPSKNPTLPPATPGPTADPNESTLGGDFSEIISDSGPADESTEANPSYWYQDSFADGCIFSRNYLPSMLLINSTEFPLLFESEEACCAVHVCGTATTADPTANPSNRPTTRDPTSKPSENPNTADPTANPSNRPSPEPTRQPTSGPSGKPTTESPTSNAPSNNPTSPPSTSRPTADPVENTARISPSLADDVPFDHPGTPTGESSETTATTASDESAAEVVEADDTSAETTVSASAEMTDPTTASNESTTPASKESTAGTTVPATSDTERTKTSTANNGLTTQANEAETTVSATGNVQTSLSPAQFCKATGDAGDALMESYSGVMDRMKDNDDEYFSALGFKADSEKDRKLFFSSLIDHEVMCCKLFNCEYWIPNIDGTDCEFGRPEQWMFDDDYRAFLLFESQDDCCIENYCTMTTTSTSAAIASSSAASSIAPPVSSEAATTDSPQSSTSAVSSMSDSATDDDPSTTTSTPGDSSVTDSMSDGSLVESVEKWYFASLIEGHEGDLRCVLGTGYTSSWIASQPSLLFDSKETCCSGTDNDAFDCEDDVDSTSSTQQLSTVASKADVDSTTVAEVGDSTDSVTSSVGPISDSMTITKTPASSMVTTTTVNDSPPGSDSPETDPATSAKWYFASLIEGHEDVRRCVLGSDYTSSWIAYQPSLLFDSEEACCAGAGNGAFDCEEEEAQLSGDAHIEEVHPTASPSSRPSAKPSPLPTHDPTSEPTSRPSEIPTKKPTDHPTSNPTNNPTAKPSSLPTYPPTKEPTNWPSNSPVGAVLYWIPDVSQDSNECIFSEPPKWMLEDEFKPYYLYESREDCCMSRPCGEVPAATANPTANPTTLPPSSNPSGPPTVTPRDTGDKWYPKALFERNGVGCELGKAYADTVGLMERFYETEEECCAAWPDLCLTSTPTTRTWYPKKWWPKAFDEPGVSGCEYSKNYEGIPLLSNYLYISSGSCCDAWPDLCEESKYVTTSTTTTTTTSTTAGVWTPKKWYPRRYVDGNWGCVLDRDWRQYEVPTSELFISMGKCCDFTNDCTVN